jgi:hypothetical protein
MLKFLPIAKHYKSLYKFHDLKYTIEDTLTKELKFDPLWIFQICKLLCAFNCDIYKPMTKHGPYIKKM